MGDGGAQPESAGSHRVRHLLSVARAHFVDRGFDAVSIDAIARAAGVSKETIYRHFADKEALFRAALEEAGEEFTARAIAAHDRAPTVVSELAGLARAILDSAIDQGMFSALWVAVSVSQRMPDLAADLREGQWRRLEPVREALEHYARERGIDGFVGPELALDFGSLAVEGPALLMGFPPPDGAARDRIAQRVAALFAQGVGGTLTVEALAGGVDMPALQEGAPPLAIPAHIRTLLEVSTRHFFDRGYEGANLDMIGAEARVGRGTLYRHFRSKAGLFDAALRAAAYDCACAVERPPIPDGRVDRAALIRFVEAALESLASDASIRVHRTVIGQSRRDPALARDIFTILRAPWAGPLTRWLRSVGLREEPDWYARQLLALALRGNRLFASGQAVQAADRRRYAERATTIFLDGFVGVM